MSDSSARAAHPDHDAEQAYIHAAREALHEMQDRAASALAFGEQSVAEENTVISHTVRSYLRDRTEDLQVGDATLAFGRIDDDPLITDGDVWYVGRRHIETEDGHPLVVDWRAPVAIPFYRATAVDAQGLALRRRFTLTGDELVALFDERFDDPESVVAAGLPDPLLAEIERSRTGEMSDIVATIAAEQDEIIRAPLAECLIVQGGPGTGKTAVGLHRAAFLLFEHRRELSTERVLVVGPNRMFLRYVGNVLPSLGETAVSQATVRSLLDVKYRVRGVDEPETHVLKGDLRMAEIIRAAALDKLKVPEETTRLPAGARSIQLEPGQVAAAQSAALARNVALNDARLIFSRLLVREARQVLASRGVDEPVVEAGTEALRRSDDFKKLVARCWPNLGATTLMQSLLTNSALLKRASADILSDDERTVLLRKAPKKGEDAEWTLADLALLDEANALCTGVSLEYGHVVVDEAQDLSAMALRVVGRRARRGSITILGDIAQATAPEAQSSWDDVIGALGVDPEETNVRQAELTVGYRVPGPLLDYANQLLPTTAPDITPSTSVRHAGPGPVMVPATETELAVAVVDAVRELAEEYETAAVITPAPLLDDVFRALTDAGLDPVDTRRSETLGAALSVVDAAVAKGLEFDVVVVVEPADFLGLYASELTGLRLLYVALTRAVHRLTIVHSKDVPAVLA
jgi:DNA helicase IV